MPSDSMSIGASGMDAYQAEIDVISNNIANVSTVGFKGQDLSFQDLLYQTQGAASAPTSTNGGVNAQQIGIGVKIGSTDTDMSQGGVQTTGVNTNMMINGNGYFVMNNTAGTATPSYTRDGDFSLSENGLLYDPSSGLAVMGYTANSSGTVSAGGTPSAIQIPIGMKSVATATGSGSIKYGPTGDKVFDMQYTGTLDSANYASAVSNGTVSATDLATASTTIYDSLGNPHAVALTFQPVISTTLPIQVENTAGSAVTAATEWSYNVTSSDGTLFSNGSTTSPTAYAFFDQNGNLINTSSSAAGTAADVHSAGTTPSVLDGNQVSVQQWGAVAGSDNAAGDAATGAVGLDFSNVVSQAAPSQVTMSQQNGYTQGTLSNISVGTDGTITGAFTNGTSQTLARVAVATFTNEEGLTRNGSNQYVASADSGAAQIGTAATGSFGSIVSDSLEMSNVSISDAFTKLITAQNAFTANSKSITTANEDLQTVVGLIH